MRLGTDAFSAGRFLDAERYHRLAFERAQTTQVSDAEVIYPMENLANDLLLLGAYMESEALFTRVLSTIRTRDIMDVPFEATVLSGLGSAYRKTGDYKHAESTLNQALHLLEKQPGSNRGELSSVLNNLGILYTLRDQRKSAENNFKKAIAILEDGSNDANLATTVANLGGLYAAHKKWSAAEPLLVRALAIGERSLGPNHPDLSPTIDALGVLYYHHRRFPAAEAAFRRALQIRSAAFGSDHASLAIIYMNIGAVLALRNADADAEAMYAEALRIQEKNGKPEDSDTLQILEHFAKLLHKLKRYSEACQMEVRAKAIRAELNYTVPASELGIFTNRYSSDRQ
jgi:tetratricopeptide (TPR) repeat protein